VIELAGFRVAIRHVLYAKGKMTQEAKMFLDRAQPDICVYGHSHQARVEWFGKMLLFNPGSAGPRRFSYPRGVGLLKLQQDLVVPNVILC
jgi:predicted phosphodiesterase